MQGTYSKLLTVGLLAGGVVLFVALMAMDGFFGPRKVAFSSQSLKPLKCMQGSITFTVTP